MAGKVYDSMKIVYVSGSLNWLYVNPSETLTKLYWIKVLYIVETFKNFLLNTYIGFLESTEKMDSLMLWFESNCNCCLLGWKEEIWQGKWKILLYSWQAFEFVCKEKGISFARGKLSPIEMWKKALILIHIKSEFPVF